MKMFKTIKQLINKPQVAPKQSIKTIAHLLLNSDSPKIDNRNLSMVLEHFNNLCIDDIEKPNWYTKNELGIFYNRVNMLIDKINVVIEFKSNNYKLTESQKEGLRLESELLIYYMKKDISKVTELRKEYLQLNK